MTQPTFQGYPDWTRRVSRATTVYLNQSSLSVGPSAEHINTYVGDVPYMGLTLFNTGSLQLIAIVRFRTGPTGTDLGGYNIHVAPGGNFRWALPVRGPFVQMTLNAPGGTTTVNVAAFEAAAPGSLDVEFITDVGLIRLENQTVAGGGFSSFDADVTWPGWAVWQVSAATDVPFTATLDQRIATSTFQRIARMTVECGQTESRLVLLPLRPMRITVFNNSSAAADFDVCLHAHGGIVE